SARPPSQTAPGPSVHGLRVPSGSVALYTSQIPRLRLWSGQIMASLGESRDSWPQAEIEDEATATSAQCSVPDRGNHGGSGAGFRCSAARSATAAPPDPGGAAAAGERGGSGHPGILGS